MMKFKYANTLFTIVVSLVLIISCSKDEDPVQEADTFEPVEFSAYNDWNEYEITDGDVLWYLVDWDTNYTTLFAEWAEADNQDEEGVYTASIKVSAYALDTNTAYFTNKTNGYGSQKKSIPLGAEQRVLLKVEIDESSPLAGTFAIRASGIVESANIEYTDLSVGNSWTEASIEANQTVGYTVYPGNATNLQIIWAEIDSPEDGYTAEIMGSVFRADGTTVYLNTENGKDFLNKNKSHSDNPKTIEFNAEDNHFKVHLMVNTSPGTYAIKVVEVAE